jgi:hypothetical protein
MYHNNCVKCRHTWKTDELVDECPECKATGSQFIGRKFIKEPSDQIPETGRSKFVNGRHETPLNVEGAVTGRFSASAQVEDKPVVETESTLEPTQGAEAKVTKKFN